MAVNQIEINKFTVLNSVKIGFSDGINVIIGENGTGKTHLLKLIYAIGISGKEDFFDFEKLFGKNGDHSGFFYYSKPFGDSYYLLHIAENEASAKEDIYKVVIESSDLYTPLMYKTAICQESSSISQQICQKGNR